MKLVLHARLMCGSLSITTPVPLLANELHGPVSLAALNQICFPWGCERVQKSIDSLKACFENVNILNKSENATSELFATYIQNYANQGRN